ncbi:MAG: aminotransferase class V-fold PLP-dependent enzyme [Gemmatimonadota bacterium]
MIRRDFLAAAATAAAVPRLRPDLLRVLGERGHGAGDPDDEAYWSTVREAFDLPADSINLDHGNIGAAPRAAIAELVRHAQEVEQFPPHRNYALHLAVTKPRLYALLGEILGVPADEIALVRNATEALDTVLLGYPLERGDEVLCSTHDYYAMLDALEHRRERDGIVLRMLRPPVPARSLDALAELYEAAITPRTRLVLLTHPSNLTGQLLPVRRIADAAHRAGALVVVDGAQSCGIVDYTIPDLGCDFYGISLHKWLGAPIGAGALWMRKEHAERVAPLVPAPKSIRGHERFSWSGTYFEPICAGAVAACALQQTIGSKRKGARLRYLTDSWRRRIEGTRGVRFYSVPGPDASCGLATFEASGITSERLQAVLWNDHRILVQDMLWGGRTPEVRGVRVTPNVYTTPAELDRFVAAVHRVVRDGG